MSIAGLTSALLLASTPLYSGSTPDLATPSQTAALSASIATDQPGPQCSVTVANTDSPAALRAPDAAMTLAQPPEMPIDATTPLAPDEIAPSAQPVEPVQTEGSLDQAGSEIVVTGRIRTPGDPLQNINAESYAITQAIDEAVVAPSAQAYEKRVPEPLRNGLRNFANNLHEPAVFVNFLLQIKPGKAVETAGRFLVNSTIGIAGLFDIAKRKPINLPRRRNGFADTLGCYGVKPGLFLFLPIVGATTVRDLIGGGVDAFAIPIPSSVGKSLSQPDVAIPTSLARELDKRVEFDEELEIIHNSNDPYVAAREYYLQKRQAQIDGLCGKNDMKSDGKKRPL
jgi:phospholipid-binding lipoprotein MlaA